MALFDIGGNALHVQPFPPRDARRRPQLDGEAHADLVRLADAVGPRLSQLTDLQPEWPWDLIAAMVGQDRPLEDRAVLSNLVVLAAQPSVADYEGLRVLVAHLGGYAVAEAQDALSYDLEPDPGLPIGTAFTLALTPLVYRPVFEDAAKVADAEVEELCAATSMRFMLQGMTSGEPAAELTTVEEFLECFEHQTLPEWRRQLVRYALDPRAPYTAQLVDLAEQSGNPNYPDGIGRFLEALRADADARERQAIADEIRRLIASTGQTQQQFAQRIGTSGPRISTYVKGTVTPSASMFLRIRRTAALIRASGE